MGLFSALGKALKGVSKVAGFIPGVGGVVGKVAGVVGNVLDSKRPMSTTGLKTEVLMRTTGGRRPTILRGTSSMTGGGLTAAVLRSTPIMPGGAWSGPTGIVASNGAAAPPKEFGGSSSRRRPAKRRAKAKRRRKARLKFGSPAWRKKYLSGRKRRRRAA
jgi:hypothetical protein